MAGRSDRERDPRAVRVDPTRTPGRDGLVARQTARLHALRQARRAQLALALTLLVAGGLTAALPVPGLLVLLGAGMAVLGLVLTPIALVLLLRVRREIRALEYEASFAAREQPGS